MKAVIYSVFLVIMLSMLLAHLYFAYDVASDLQKKKVKRYLKVIATSVSVVVSFILILIVFFSN